MPRPKLSEQAQYLTMGKVCRQLGISAPAVRLRIVQGIFPPPVKISLHGVFLFDNEWLRAAKSALKRG